MEISESSYLKSTALWVQNPCLRGTSTQKKTLVLTEVAFQIWLKVESSCVHLEAELYFCDIGKEGQDDGEVEVVGWGAHVDLVWGAWPGWGGRPRRIDGEKEHI